MPLPSAPTAAVPPTGKTSVSPYFPTDATPLAVAAVASVGQKEMHGSYVEADECETVAAVAADT